MRTTKLIHFHRAEMFHMKHRKETAKFLLNMFKENGFQVQEIHFWFMQDDEIKKINTQYLNHPNPTDVITFVYENNPILSDVFLGTQTIVKNAQLYRVSKFTELLRVMCHACLHVLGYKDKTKKEKDIMRKKEDEWVELFHVKHLR